MILQASIYISLVLFGVSILLFLYRVIKGYFIADRVLALDCIGIALVSIAALISMLQNTPVFVDVLLIIGLLALIGTVSYARFEEKGKVIVRDRTKS